MTDAKGKINLPVVDFVKDNLTFIRDEVVPGLTPYVHTGGRRN
jgi:hypothetical protein